MYLCVYNKFWKQKFILLEERQRSSNGTFYWTAFEHLSAEISEISCVMTFAFLSTLEVQMGKVHSLVVRASCI